jgi:hypothetical protein
MMTEGVSASHIVRRLGAAVGRHASLLLALFLGSGAPQVWAQPVDPLWTEALRHIKAQQEWAARETDETVVTESRSGERKTFRVRRLFDSRVEGKPRYKVQEVIPSSMTSEAETIRIAEIVAQMESLVFTADAKIDRKDSELLDGVPAIRLDASAIAGTLQLWVDPATGTPLRYTLRASLPLVVSAEIRCEFRRSDAGLGFPARRTHDISIRIPFKGARLQSEVQFSDWVRQ